jgi:hypothetical protein
VLRAGAWHTVTLCVDAVGGWMRTYVDGAPSATVQAAQLCRDGQYALRGRIALFFEVPSNRSYDACRIRISPPSDCE